MLVRSAHSHTCYTVTLAWQVLKHKQKRARERERQKQTPFAAITATTTVISPDPTIAPSNVDAPAVASAATITTTTTTTTTTTASKPDEERKEEEEGDEERKEEEEGDDEEGEEDDEEEDEEEEEMLRDHGDEERIDVVYIPHPTHTRMHTHHDSWSSMHISMRRQGVYDIFHCLPYSSSSCSRAGQGEAAREKTKS